MGNCFTYEKRYQMNGERNVQRTKYQKVNYHGSSVIVYNSGIPNVGSRNYDIDNYELSIEMISFYFETLLGKIAHCL